MIGLWYTALAAYGLWPLVPRLATRVNADQTDGAGFLWQFLEIPGRLAHLQSPFASARMFHPVGADLSFDTGSPVVGLVVALLLPILGLALAVNLSTIVGGALSGVAAHLIAKHEGAGNRAAFVAGTIFLLLPARYERQGTHFNLFHSEFFAFGLLALVKLRDQPTRLRTLVFGLLFGLTYLNDVTYAVMLAMLFVVLLAPERRLLRLGVRRYLLIAASSVAVCGPLLFAQISSVLREGGGRTIGDSHVAQNSSDLLSWVLPPAWHPVWGHVFSSRFGPMNLGEPVSYAGIAVLVLAAIGAWHRWRSRTAWVASALIFGVLSLGPFLKVAGRTGSGFVFAGSAYRVPLPFLALQQLPVLNGLRAPGRFAIPAGLALAVLAAVGVSRLSAAHLALRRLPILALALVLAELPADSTPYAMATAVPKPYLAIAGDPADGAVLELPILWGDGTRGLGSDPSGRSPEVFRYWNRASHGKPIVSGHVARLSDHRLDELRSYAAYRTILALEGQIGFPDENELTVSRLHELGIRYVVYHRDHAAPLLFDRVRSLALDVLADDGTVIVWRVPQ